jgi:hypothetical protein
MMKLKVQHLMDATLVISQIIREDRKLPQKGKYRLARMHPKLNKEFLIINAQRDEMIKAYNFHATIPNPAAANMTDETRAEIAASGNVHQLVPKMIESPEFSVPADKIAEFMATWQEIADQEIEVDIEPLPLDQLCFPGDLADGSIAAHEFIVLGSLVVE